MLQAVRDLAPELYPLVYSAYSAPSDLHWSDHLIVSAEGVQQGDPLGPLLFCLTLHRHSQHLVSPLVVLYLDDVTLGGHHTEICQDLRTITKLEEDLGLALNCLKSEIITSNPTVSNSLLTHLPQAQVVDPANATLLGSPLGNLNCISDAITEKIQTLRRVGKRLEFLSAHDALLLLIHSFSMPKLMYLLRTAPCFKSPSLAEYDAVLCSILSKVTNTPLEPNNPYWSQASLPVKSGGLGVRSAVELAPSAFLSSTHASQPLVNAILPSHLSSLQPTITDEALLMWSSGHNNQPPSGTAAERQASWDCHEKFDPPGFVFPRSQYFEIFGPPGTYISKVH